MLEIRPYFGGCRKNIRYRYKYIRPRMMKFEGTYLGNRKVHTGQNSRYYTGSPNMSWQKIFHFVHWADGKTEEEVKKKWFNITEKYWKKYGKRLLKYNEIVLGLEQGRSYHSWRNKTYRGRKISSMGLFIDDEGIVRLCETMSYSYHKRFHRRESKWIERYNKEHIIIPENPKFLEKIGEGYVKYYEDIKSEHPVPVYIVRCEKYYGISYYGGERNTTNPYMDSWIKVFVPGIKNVIKKRAYKNIEYLFVTKKVFIMKKLFVDVAWMEDHFQYSLKIDEDNLVSTNAGKTEEELREAIEKDLEFHYLGTTPIWYSRKEYVVLLHPINMEASLMIEDEK